MRTLENPWTVSSSKQQWRRFATSCACEALAFWTPLSLREPPANERLCHALIIRVSAVRPHAAIVARNRLDIFAARVFQSIRADLPGSRCATRTSPVHTKQQGE